MPTKRNCGVILYKSLVRFKNDFIFLFVKRTMSSSGTLLSDLEGGSANFEQDNDLIKRIMADVNSGNANQVLAPPAPAPPMNVISAPNPNTTIQHTMDNGPATAHIIGRDHPSAGDFQDAIQNTAIPMMAPMASGQQPAQWQPQAPMNMYVPPPSKKWTSAIFDELKLPVFVAIIVFVFSLPILNIIMANYLPSMVKPSGDLTTIGLALKSLLAGATFWILQRIIVPLLSL
jgi:hypothetical protein